MKKVILFGPLFTQAERLWNKLLKQSIESESNGEFTITLPQEESSLFIHKDKIDFDGIVASCLTNARTYDLALAILDGSDVDSGTCVEIGYRKGCDWDLPVLGVRTDFRLSEDGGLNAMLRICDKVIYFASFNENISELARIIITELRLLAKDDDRRKDHALR